MPDFTLLYLLSLNSFSFFLSQSIDPGQQFTWENSNMEVNKPKNRYANVIAYDHSRVVLTSVDGKSSQSHLSLQLAIELFLHWLNPPTLGRYQGFRVVFFYTSATSLFDGRFPVCVSFPPSMQQV